MQILGLEEDGKKITFEDIFLAIDFDIQGKECKMEGIESIRRTLPWIEQGHSNNFEMRWAWIARTIIVNIVEPDYSAWICQKIAKWGMDKSNRGKLGRILDYMCEVEIDLPNQPSNSMKGVKMTTVSFDDKTKKSFEDFLVELAPELFEHVKMLANGESFTNGNIFVRVPEERDDLIKTIGQMNAYDWDKVFLVQSKGAEFLESIAKTHSKIFRKAIKLAETLAQLTQFKCLTPGKTSLDFMSHMAEGYTWLNGMMVGTERFSNESLPFISKKLPLRNPYEALTAYAFYILEAGEAANQLMRLITDNPARLRVLLNLVTHKGKNQYVTLTNEPCTIDIRYL